jgi:hypothetical protein
MRAVDGKNGMNLSMQDLRQFHNDGFVYIKGFYDLTTEILPILKDIYRIIGMIIREYNLPIKQAPFTQENFDAGLPEIVEKYRNYAGILYDAVKKLPSYVRLSNCKKHEDLTKILLATDFPGFANRGYGMRMDHPSEDKFLTQWHQDYVSQLCSLNGIVLWSPLRNVTSEMGPFRLCPASHRDGIFPIVRAGEGSYGLKIKDEEKIVARYSSIVAEVFLGDLIVIDFKTLHTSSPNRSNRTRWAMISRYFDFLEPVGISHNWKGGLQEGNSFEQVHPELSEIRVKQACQTDLELRRK